MSIGREPNEVVVITGTGGMGIAIARRLGHGRQLVLADYAEDQLEAVASLLRGEGHWVSTQRTDVSNADQVAALAAFAAGRGHLVTVVHTAGVSPVQATPDRVVSVDLIGTAHLLDAFVEHAGPGMTLVCIASMAGSMVPLPPELEQALAKTPTSELAALPFLDPAALDAQSAYPLAKRANQLRVQAMAGAYGRKGARVVSISPGVISTPMGQAELSGPAGDMMRGMVEASATGRLGTPDDIATAVMFLSSPEASFITGVDLLVDGGVIASMRWP
jgi:NAD(P)-dependent dehydrogenase (short-subunit alcohol dehydrogenase family)